MIAINPPKRAKQLIVLFSMLLFLFSASGSLFSQQSRIMNKPSGLNTWKPAHLLPSNVDNSIPVVRTDFTITVRDGIVMDCLKFVPEGAAPQGGWPTVIMVHGYGDNKETLAEFCRLQAEYGYYTMTYSVRGQGLSGGVSNLISIIEADDLIDRED